MDAPLAVAPLAGAGVVAAAAAAALVLLAPVHRIRVAAMAAALLIAPAVAVAEVWDSPPLRALRDRPLLAAAVVAGALVAIAALALLLRRRPLLLPPLAVAALPFRLPIEAGGEAANLLLPLYLVVAAGCVAHAWPAQAATASRDGRSSGLSLAQLLARDGREGRVMLALAAVVVLYAVQSLYAEDPEQALKNVVLFYVPFALLLVLLRALPWSPRLVLQCLVVALALAVAFVCVGFVEFGTRSLLLNPKLIASNQFESYFRVNSLFFDPNIYGRFLAMVMVALAAILLWSRRELHARLAAVALALLWAGLVLSFSQSSFGALLVGLAVLGLLRWRPRSRVLVAGACGAAALAGVALALALGTDLESARSLDRSTSGRLDLIAGGVEMFADRPLHGFGAGSFADVFRAREDVSSRTAVSASHTIPVTIAAEQGVIGLAAYGLLLWSAFALLFASLRSRLADGRPDTWTAARATVAAAFSALVFHTLVYAAFLEDPLAWTLLALGMALALPPSAEPSAPASPAGEAARTRTATSSP